MIPEAADLAWLSTPLAADAAAGAGVVEPGIHPLRPAQRVAGRVSTCSVVPGDNLYVRRALERGPVEGDVLVVAGASESGAAVLGGLVAEALVAAGFRAVVTDGPVRDSEEIAAAGLLVWSRGTAPRGPAKQGPGTLGEPVRLGGVEISPGDLVIADADGIVVWPAPEADRLLEAARERDARDRRRVEELRRTGRLD